MRKKINILIFLNNYLSNYIFIVQYVSDEDIANKFVCLYEKRVILFD